MLEIFSDIEVDLIAEADGRKCVAPRLSSTTRRRAIARSLSASLNWRSAATSKNDAGHPLLVPRRKRSSRDFPRRHRPRDWHRQQRRQRTGYPDEAHSADRQCELGNLAGPTRNCGFSRAPISPPGSASRPRDFRKRSASPRSATSVRRWRNSTRAIAW